MYGWLIVLIILILTIGIISSLYRKKLYKEVDRLETWKVQLMNSPLVNEIAKLKELSASEQTEKAVEQWKTEWDNIVNHQFPEAEELLFDIEEAIDRYQFRNAKQLIEDNEKLLKNVEEIIDQIMAEIDTIINSGSQNELEEQEVENLLVEVKETLIENHETYGTAVLFFETEMANIERNFEKYRLHTEEGLFIEARQLLTDVKAKLLNMKRKMEIAPDIYEQVQKGIPTEIRTLKEGFEEMLQHGYFLEHIPVEQELAKFHAQLKIIKKYIANAELDQALESLNEIQEKIDVAYEALEEEVQSKHIVTNGLNDLRLLLDDASETLLGIKVDTENVKRSYHIDIDDLHTTVKLEEEVIELTNRFNTLAQHVEGNDKGFTLLHQEMKELNEKLIDLKQSQLAFQEMLHTLRKDELRAKETLKKLREKIILSKRMLERSNLPGVPDSYTNDVEYMEEKIVEVYEQLSKTPLQLNVINQLLRDVVTHVEKSFEKTELLIKHAQLTEKYIQYANRYRSRSNEIAEKLQEAEEAFRTFNYHEAYEISKYVIENTNPQIIEKFEEEQIPTPL